MDRPIDHLFLIKSVHNSQKQITPVEFDAIPTQRDRIGLLRNIIGNAIYVPHGFQIDAHDRIQSFQIGRGSCFVHIINNSCLIRSIAKIIGFFNFVAKAMRLEQRGLKTEVHIVFNLKSKSKTYPAFAESFTSQHINSAVTLKLENQPLHFVYMFRKDDWKKVLIHELIHLRSLDMAHLDTNRVSDYISKRYGVQSTVLIKVSEAITESLASYIFLLSSVPMQSKFSVYSATINALLKQSRHHFTDMVHQYLLINNRTTFIERKSGHIIHQMTHAFEYIVLKTILFSNINYFLNWYVDVKDVKCLIKYLDMQMSRFSVSKVENIKIKAGCRFKFH